MSVYRQLAYIEGNTSLVLITRINDEGKSKIRIKLELFNLNSNTQGWVEVTPVKTAQEYVQILLHLFMSHQFNNFEKLKKSSLKILPGKPPFSSFFLTGIFESLQSKGIA